MYCAPAPRWMKGSGGTRPRPNNERGRRRRRRRRRPSRRAQEVCRDGNSSSSNDTRTRWHLAGSCANSSGPSLFEEWASSLAGAYLLCHTHTHTHTHYTHTGPSCSVGRRATCSCASSPPVGGASLFLPLLLLLPRLLSLLCLGLLFFSGRCVCVCDAFDSPPVARSYAFRFGYGPSVTGFLFFRSDGKGGGGGGEGIDSCISFSTHHWSGFYCLLLVASLRYILHFQLTRNCFVWIHWMDWTTSSIKGTSYGDGWFDLLSSFQLTYGITILRLTPKSSIEFPFTRPSLYFLLLYRVNWSDTPLILVDNIILPLVTKKSLMGTSFFYRVVSGSGGLGSDSAAGRVEFKTCEVRIQLEMFHSEVLISGPILRQSRMS